MSRSKFDRLIDQFYEREGNLRAQQVLLRQIAGMHDPQSIPELLAIYKRKDAPASLRAIAGQGLREFWLLNQRVSEGNSGLRGAAIEPWLRRARPFLAGILIVTLVLNVAILIIRAIPAPTQSTPSAVADLGSLYKTQIAQAQATGHTLRLRWQEVQSQIKVNCDVLTPTPASPITPAPIDLTTYPGLAQVNTDLDMALTQLAVMQTNLNAICAAPGDATVIASASGNQGAAGQIVTVDVALKQLDAAQADLDRWLAAPIPSATASPLPPTAVAGTSSPVPSATALPSATPLPSATSLPPPGGPSPTALPPTAIPATALPPTPTLPPTAVPPTAIPSATPVSTITISGLGLADRTSYRYVLTVIATGLANGTSTTNSLSITALRPAAPLTDNAQTQYDIALSEPLAWLQPLNLLYQNGQVRHVLLNGAYYYDTLQPGGIACQVVPSTRRAAPLQAIDPEAFLKPLFGVALTRATDDQTISGVPVHHYHADQTVGTAPATTTLSYDVFVSADARQIPLEVKYAANGVITNAITGLSNAPIPRTEQLLSYSASFTLTEIDPVISVAAPAECK